MFFSVETVIGGQLANYITDNDVARLQDFLDDKFYAGTKRPGITISRHNDNAVGAAIYYINRFLLQPLESFTEE